MKRQSINVEHSITTANFDVTPENWSHKAVLTNVDYELKKNKDDETITYDTINFLFRGSSLITEGDNPHVEMFKLTYFAILNDSKKGTSKEVLMRYQDKALAHIYDTFTGIGKHKTVKLGSIASGKETTWKEFYNSIQQEFNTGKNGKPVYKTNDDKYIVVWLKLKYDNVGQLDVPSGNFLDVYRNGRVSLLRKGNVSQYVRPIRKRNTPGVQDMSEPEAPKGF